MWVGVIALLILLPHTFPPVPPGPPALDPIRLFCFVWLLLKTASHPPKSVTRTTTSSLGRMPNKLHPIPHPGYPHPHRERERERGLDEGRQKHSGVGKQTLPQFFRWRLLRTTDRQIDRLTDQPGKEPAWHDMHGTLGRISGTTSSLESMFLTPLHRDIHHSLTLMHSMAWRRGELFSDHPIFFFKKNQGRYLSS